jgi:hypothetical protein
MAQSSIFLSKFRSSGPFFAVYIGRRNIMEWIWNDELLLELDVEMVAAELVELCNGYSDDEAFETMMEAVLIAMEWRMSIQLN